MSGFHICALRSPVFGFASAMLFVTALFATPAGAGPISVNSFTGAWSDPVGGTITSETESVANGLDAINWGIKTDAYTQESGYTFKPGDTIGNLGTGTFLLGTFTHVNQPIPGGTAISSVDYQLSFGFTGVPNVIDVLLQFSHNETLNDPALCAPLTHETGACPDIVTVDVPLLNLLLTGADGNEYYFNLVGFSQDGGVSVTSQFFSPEYSNNSAGLYGRLSSEPAMIPNPEPATLVLIGTGLAGAVAARRRRKMKG